MLNTPGVLALLQAGREPLVRRSPTAPAAPTAPSRAARSVRPGRCRAIRRRRSASTAPATAGAIPMDLSGIEDAHGRVLAEVELVRQQRRAGDGVHPELQQPDAAASWSIRTRPSVSSRWRSATAASRNIALFPRPSAGRLAPLRPRARHHRHRARRDHPLRRRAGGQPTRNGGYAGTGAGNFANSTLYLMSRGGIVAVRQRHARPARDLQRRSDAPTRSSTTTPRSGTNKPPTPPSRQPRPGPSPVRT